MPLMLRYLSEVVNRESQSDSAAEHQRTHTSETAPVDAAKTTWFDDAPENMMVVGVCSDQLSAVICRRRVQ